MKITSTHINEIRSEDRELSLIVTRTPCAEIEMCSVRSDDSSRLTMRFDARETAQITLFFSEYFIPAEHAHQSRRVNHNVATVTIDDEQGSRFELYYDNMGEPYRNGFSVAITHQETQHYAFFTSQEVDTVLRAITS